MIEFSTIKNKFKKNLALALAPPYFVPRMENHTENQLATVGSLPVGEFFKINPSPSAKVYRRGAYDRSARAYWANDCSDISNGRLLKAGRVVFVGFTY